MEKKTNDDVAFDLLGKHTKIMYDRYAYAFNDAYEVIKHTFDKPVVTDKDIMMMISKLTTMHELKIIIDGLGDYSHKLSGELFNKSLKGKSLQELAMEANNNDKSN